MEKLDLNSEWKELALARVAELLDSVPEGQEHDLGESSDLHAIFEKLLVIAQEQKIFNRKSTQSLQALESSVAGVPKLLSTLTPSLSALEAKIGELEKGLEKLSVKLVKDPETLDDRWSLPMGMLGRIERVQQQLANPPRSSFWKGKKAKERAWEGVRQAIDILWHHLLESMSHHGLERMNVVGLPFDPRTMIAVDLRIEPEVEAGRVIEECSPGFISQGRVVRPAEVVVSKGKY